MNSVGNAIPVAIGRHFSTIRGNHLLWIWIESNSGRNSRNPAITWPHIEFHCTLQSIETMRRKSTKADSLSESCSNGWHYCVVDCIQSRYYIEWLSVLFSKSHRKVNIVWKRFQSQDRRWTHTGMSSGVKFAHQLFVCVQQWWFALRPEYASRILIERRPLSL